MKLRRFLSCMMALLLVCGLPLAAFADTYDIAKGSIEISASAEGGQTVSQGGGPAVIDNAPVITGTTTENTVTITAEKGAEANVTLDGVIIDLSGTGTVKPEPNPGEAAVRITGEGNVTIELDGENTVQGGYLRAGVEKNDADSSGSLTITDENGTDGSLKATGGDGGSGIGGGLGGSGSDITIEGSAEVTAQGGECGSGIGGGDGGSGSNITISGSAQVEATGGLLGSGIGGSDGGSGSNITISGSAQVEATGGLYGAGIGGGYNHNGNGTGSNITISGDAQVKAQGGNSSYSNGPGVSRGAGAAIGNGGQYMRDSSDVDALKGEDAVVTTDAPQDDESYGLYVGELNEGWVATYEPGEDMGTEKPGSLTYQDASGAVTTEDDSSNIGLEAALLATADTHGHEAGFKVGNKVIAVTTHNYGDYVSNPDATCTHDGTKTATCTVPGCTETHTIPDPAKGHNVPNGTPNGDATCVALGTMTGICTICNTEVTVPDPNYGPHTFTTYTPDPDHLATCTEAGTKTAVCDVCKNATDTIPDPAKNHSMGDFSTYKEATCTEAGEERAYCKNKCGHYETKDIPPQGHSFTKYISDGNATYDSDGTKTAKCDRCDATDTLPDPGSKLVFLPGEYYKVIGKDGKALVCKETNQNGVLTITAEEDFATLTGSLSGMKTLKAHGIGTIVFVTKDATSTFAVEDLLSQGASGDSYCLTHDGSTVTFTLGDGTDIRKILK